MAVNNASSPVIDPFQNEEYAFYSVLKENDSTNFLDDNRMKELIHTIVDVVRKNATRSS